MDAFGAVAAAMLETLMAVYMEDRPMEMKVRVWPGVPKPARQVFVGQSAQVFVEKSVKGGEY
jgi:hypothetical protein